MMRWGWVCIGLLLLRLGPPGHGAEKPQPPSDKEIKVLIDELVSPNRKPNVEEGASAVPGLPRDFDRKKQQQVDRERREEPHRKIANELAVQA